jgi:hypothetical protein
VGKYNTPGGGDFREGLRLSKFFYSPQGLFNSLSCQEYISHNMDINSYLGEDTWDTATKNKGLGVGKQPCRSFASMAIWN